MAADDTLPAEPKDLTPFWTKVESAIKSLDTSFSNLNDPALFHYGHVSVFGPLILGPVGWV